MLCDYCSSNSAQLRCSRCTVVYYCNANCQRQAWKAHSYSCRKPSEVAVCEEPPAQNQIPEEEKRPELKFDEPLTDLQRLIAAGNVWEAYSQSWRSQSELSNYEQMVLEQKGDVNERCAASYMYTTCRAVRMFLERELLTGSADFEIHFIGARFTREGWIPFDMLYEMLRELMPILENLRIVLVIPKDTIDDEDGVVMARERIEKAGRDNLSIDICESLYHHAGLPRPNLACLMNAGIDDQLIDMKPTVQSLMADNVPTLVTGYTCLEKHFGQMTHDGYMCEWVLKRCGVRICQPTMRNHFAMLDRCMDLTYDSRMCINGIMVLFCGTEETPPPFPTDTATVLKHTRIRWLMRLADIDLEQQDIMAVNAYRNLANKINSGAVQIPDRASLIDMLQFCYEV